MCRLGSVRLWHTLRADQKRYRPPAKALVSAGFWVVALYRAKKCAVESVPNVARGATESILDWLMFPITGIWGVRLSAEAQVGPGLLLLHPFNIDVPAGSSVGHACTIYHDTHLGSGPMPGVPCLGDHVVLFSGSKVQGGIRIGDHAEITGNAVVDRDIPANTIVLPPPVRVTRKAGTRGESDSS